MPTSRQGPHCTETTFSPRAFLALPIPGGFWSTTHGGAVFSLAKHPKTDPGDIIAFIDLIYIYRQISELRADLLTTILYMGPGLYAQTGHTATQV